MHALDDSKRKKTVNKIQSIIFPNLIVIAALKIKQKQMMIHKTKNSNCKDGVAGPVMEMLAGWTPVLN